MKRKILMAILPIPIMLFSLPPPARGFTLEPFYVARVKHDSYRPSSPQGQSWRGSENGPLEGSEPKLWSEIPYSRVTFRDMCERLFELGIRIGGEPSNSFALKPWGYRAIPMEELRRFLEWYAKERVKSEDKFIAGSAFWLCADAALDFLVAARRWYPEIAIALTWGFPAYANYSAHAFCIFIDTERRVWVIDWVKRIVMPIEEEPGLILRGLMKLFM